MCIKDSIDKLVQALHLQTEQTERFVKKASEAERLTNLQVQKTRNETQQQIAALSN
jgi:hypothetical protein